MKTKTTQSTDHVWVLKNNMTGRIYPQYTYNSRESARKAIRSKSGRFKGYTPVKVTRKDKKTTSTGKSILKGAKQAAAYVKAKKAAKAIVDTFYTPPKTTKKPSTPKALVGLMGWRIGQY